MVAKLKTRVPTSRKSTPDPVARARAEVAKRHEAEASILALVAEHGKANAAAEALPPGVSDEEFTRITTRERELREQLLATEPMSLPALSAKAEGLRLHLDTNATTGALSPKAYPADRIAWALMNDIAAIAAPTKVEHLSFEDEARIGFTAWPASKLSRFKPPSNFDWSGEPHPALVMCRLAWGALHMTKAEMTAKVIEHAREGNEEAIGELIHQLDFAQKWFAAPAEMLLAASRHWRIALSAAAVKCGAADDVREVGE